MSATPSRRRRRLRRRLALSALLATFFVSLAPGVAAAAPPSSGSSGVVFPFIDCYVKNSDGGYTFVLGYTSTYASTVDFSHGNDDHVWPAAHQSQVPTSFDPGTHHGAWSFTIKGSDLPDARWEIDGTTLSFEPVLRFIPTCSAPTEMPAWGNGTGGAIALGVAGLIGVLLLRRATKREAAAAALRV